jgi:uncharacterized protein (TIGR02453 family)
MTWFVYIARCGDGTLYTGVSTDPARRQALHNTGRGAAYTRSRRPIRIIHQEPAAGRGDALRREAAIKRMHRGAKEALVGWTGHGNEMAARLNDKRKAPSTGATAEFAGFRPGALRFLRRLARNNRRDWFERHRPEYEVEVKGPLSALVEEMDVRLATIAPELLGDPRRSIFRIHRDVRFSADKSPYKTNAACQFYHQDAGRGAGQDAEGAGAGLYFQLADGDCFVAGGIWMPARSTLDKIREEIAARHEELEEIVRAPAFRRRFKRLTEEAMLKRTPRGYDEQHPAARWLKYRSFTVWRQLSESEVLDPRLPATLARDFTTMVPLVRWLNGAIGYRPAASRV